MTRETTLRLITAAAACGLLTGCEVGKKYWEDSGYRGTGMAQIHDSDITVAKAAIPDPPYDLPPDDGGQRAGQAYQNVRVLQNMSVDQFNHFMSAMSQWVGGDAGNCAYCHNVNNFAEDTVYTKNVARRMIQMTWNVNGNWTSHVQQTGVTCYTCHRGQGVPKYYWSERAAERSRGLSAFNESQNEAHPNVGYASLPNNAFGPYFGADPRSIRLQNNDSAYPSPQQTASLKDTEHTYGLMMHFSTSLGVNCTYCHNSRAFSVWEQGNGTRANAWYGIRMIRDSNVNYIDGLANIFPKVRKGPDGDPFKINCATCHQGQWKPLNGQSMLPDYPYLRASAGYSADGPRTVGVVPMQAAYAPAADTDGVTTPPGMGAAGRDATGSGQDAPALQMDAGPMMTQDPRPTAMGDDMVTPTGKPAQPVR